MAWFRLIWTALAVIAPLRIHSAVCDGSIVEDGGVIRFRER